SVPWYLEKGPVPFVVRVFNDSDHVIAPQGEIVITNMYGQKIGKVELLPVNILSDSIRSMPDKNMSWDLLQEQLSTQSKNQKMKAVWNEQFLLGLYSAKLRLKLSDSGPILRKTL